MTANVPLWQPSPERIAKANITAFARRAEAIAGRPLPDYAALWQWSNDEREAFWRAAVGFRGRHRRARRAHADRRRSDAGRALVSRRAAQLRGEPARTRGADDATDALVFRGEDQRAAARDARASSRRPASRVAAALRAMGVAPGDRVAAFMPNMPEAIIAMLGATRARRDLVVVLAGFRRPRRARPLRPDRAARARSPSTATGTTARRMPILDKVREIVARPADGRARRRRSLPRSDPAGRPHDLAAIRGAVALGRLPRAARAGADRLRALAVRPSALHPVLVRHDRRAEVHRARRRRHAAAAPEGAPAARRPQARRPAVLLHDLRLDDVELARLGARARARRCCSTTARRSSTAARALWDFAEDERITHFGTSAKYIDAAKKIGVVPRKDYELAALAHDVLDRQPARARELRLRLPVREGRPLPVVDLRRHRHRLLLRARQSDAAGLARRAAVPRPRHGGRRLRRRRQADPGRERQGRARLHGAVSVDAGRLLERSRRRASTAPRTSSAFPASGVTATTSS